MMLLCFLLVVVMSISSSESLSCKDELGRNVDWFMGYKFPVIGSKDTRSGYYYSIVSNLERNSQWILPDKLISHGSSAIMRTLAPAYDKKQKTLSKIFYNDAPPNKEGKSPSGRAHAKGVLMIDHKSGQSVWLTHTVPRFPSKFSDGLNFEKNAGVFGQTFFCVSFDLATSGIAIINHLNMIYPLVYDYKITDELGMMIPTIYDMVDNKNKRRVKSEVPTMKQEIKTGLGQDLLLFSKSPDYAGDIYSDALDLGLQSSLFVSTWRSGSGNKLHSVCPDRGFHVNNIIKYQLKVGSESIDWSYRNDHGKWAISSGPEAGIVCIGDLNRMKSQFKRGGGALCIKCPFCWYAFASTIQKVEDCPSPDDTDSSDEYDSSLSYSSDEGYESDN